MNRNHLKLFSFILAVCSCNGQVLTSTVQGVTPGQAVQATSADSFVDSIGVATHWSFPAYTANTSRLSTLLIASGIRHVRDGANPSAMKTLAPYGIKETVVIDPPHGIVPNLSYWSGAAPTNTYAVADYIKNYMPANSVDALEMPNELDIFNYLYKWHPTDASTLSTNPTDSTYYGAYGQAVTVDCWNAIKSDPTLANIKIIGPTIGVQVPTPYPSESLYNYVDWGGMHSYPGRTNTWTYPQEYGTITKYYWNSFQPSGNIGTDSYGGNPLMFSWYQPPFRNGSIAKPMAVTETGYQTGTQSAGAISVTAQAKYTPRLYAEYFRNGIPRTFIYELFDEGTDPTNQQDNYGLVYNNLTPKPAFVATSRLISLLEEKGASFNPASLNYSLSVYPYGAYSRVGYVHDLLLQKSSGAFYLLLWHEISDSSNTDTNGNLLPTIQRDINPPALLTSVTLPSNITSATLYTYDQNWNLQPRAVEIMNGKVMVPASDTISVLKLTQATPEPGGFFSEGVYSLTNAASGLAMDDPASSTQSGTQLIQWPFHSGDNQEWSLAMTSTGSYTIQNVVSKMYLTAGGVTNASPLVQEAFTGSMSQLWSITPNGIGYSIVNLGTKMAIDDPGSNPNQGTGLIVWPSNGNPNQTWLIH